MLRVRPVGCTRGFGESFHAVEQGLTGGGRQPRERGRQRLRVEQRVLDQEITEYDPPRVLAWRHLAERLDGKPAPRFARSTEMDRSLARPAEAVNR
jgi:hypothetical protein